MLKSPASTPRAALPRLAARVRLEQSLSRATAPAPPPAPPLPSALSAPRRICRRRRRGSRVPIISSMTSLKAPCACRPAARSGGSGRVPAPAGAFPAAQEHRADETRPDATVDVLARTVARQGQASRPQARRAAGSCRTRRSSPPPVRQNSGGCRRAGICWSGNRRSSGPGAPRRRAWPRRAPRHPGRPPPHLVDEKALGHNVALAKEQHAVRRFSIASGAARLLIVAFQILGHIVVDDKAHVALSMPMPKALVATITKARS